MKLFNIWSIFVIITIAYTSNVNARFGQQNVGDPLFHQIATADVGYVGNYLGGLAGAAVRTLLAKSLPCALQQVADQVIDIAYHVGKNSFLFNVINKNFLLID